MNVMDHSRSGNRRGIIELNKMTGILDKLMVSSRGERDAGFMCTRENPEILRSLARTCAGISGGMGRGPEISTTNTAAESDTQFSHASARR